MTSILVELSVLGEGSTRPVRAAELVADGVVERARDR